ncbi:MAG: tRNA preQ1(34) S-adenosylmethionine ribosyltransferase-isomerase QueA [Patescibacteria group bacterium]|nr:tRNA preQ1(34) S-adenosylmethionine ribosyltransferase-isomerase QueA [Patescibacteria group bacterium]
MSLEQELKSYDYSLPKELIAQKPARPREQARLLVYGRKQHQVFLDTFAHIGKYLPKNSVLVFNQTRVIPARLKLTKSTGGKVEILYVSQDQNLIKALANRKIKIGETLKIPGSRKSLRVEAKTEHFYFLKPSFSLSGILPLLKKSGSMPLPPYIKSSPLNEKQKREEYQTVFARKGISVAAPTASLHFTKQLLKALKKQGIGIKFINLNVGLGTFAPLTADNLQTGKLHTETYEIDPTTAGFLNQAKRQGRPIIAVGTTVIRTLESASLGQNELSRLQGDTNLFIRTGYRFNFIDGMVTNFHVPKSSLMMLVAAYTGKTRLKKLYQQAIRQKFRFFSFGDGMLILP